MRLTSTELRVSSSSSSSCSGSWFGSHSQIHQGAAEKDGKGPSIGDTYTYKYPDLGGSEVENVKVASNVEDEISQEKKDGLPIGPLAAESLESSPSQPFIVPIRHFLENEFCYRHRNSKPG